MEIKHLSDKGSKNVTPYQFNQTCHTHYCKRITLLHQVITLELRIKRTQKHILRETLIHIFHN